MTATSAASTLGNSWNRRLPDFSESLEPQPMPPCAKVSGARFSPPSLATLDLPQGRVLLVVGEAVVALDLQRLLHDAGYRVVGPAITVAEIQRMIQRGDLDCAILDLEIDRRAPLPIADLLAFRRCALRLSRHRRARAGAVAAQAPARRRDALQSRDPDRGHREGHGGIA